MPSSEYLSTVPEEILRLPERGINTGTGKDQESKIPNATAARSLISVALVEDSQRSKQRALVRGQYDGNPPFNQAKLNQDGMGWCCNLNWLGMEGRIDGARVPYYQLFSGVPTYVTACSYKAEGSPEKAYWEEQYAKVWTEVHNRWRQFKWHVQAQQFEMLFEGWGPVLREDDSDWRFRSIPARSVLVPQGSPSSIDKRLPWIAVRVPYRIHELFNKIKDPEIAEKTGYNVQAVQDAIKYHTRGEGGAYPYRQQQWEVWQEKFKNRELDVSYTSADIVYTDHLYVMEYSGKVSHMIFVEGTMGTEATASEFLFKRLHRYDSYDQVIHCAFQNTGDGTWHSVRGMAYKSFKAEAAMDRLQNRAVDNAFLSSGITVQVNDQRSMDRRQLSVTQGMTVIPPGCVTVDRNSSAGQMEGVLSVASYIRNQVDQKLGSYQQRSLTREDGKGEQPTATQIQATVAKEASLSNGQMDNYFLDLDTMDQETDRRLKISGDPEAVWFREECERRGIPREIMMDMRVKANRISGYGSPAARKQALQESMALAPMLNPEGKNNWLNEAIGTVCGPDKIGIFNPPVHIPDDEDAIISSENSQFRLSIEPPVIGNAVRHLEGHLGYATTYLEPLAAATEQGQPLEMDQLQDALEYIKVMVPHAGQHLEQLKGDPSQQANYKLFTTQLKNLVGFNGKLFAEYRHLLQQQQQAQMEQQQMNAVGLLDQTKAQAMQHEIERADYKAQHDAELKALKTKHDLELKNYKAKAGVSLESAKVATQISHDRLTTAAEIQSKKDKASSNGSRE